MSSLLMIFWCSIISIGIRIIGQDSITLDWIEISFQLMCVIAASVQVGHIESGDNFYLRRPLQILVFTVFIAQLILSAPLFHFI